MELNYFGATMIESHGQFSSVHIFHELSEGVLFFQEDGQNEFPFSSRRGKKKCLNFNMGHILPND